jgi:hypothetical protein
MLDLAFLFAESILKFGPDGGTRTHDLRYPKPSRYQTALHPDILLAGVLGIEPSSQGFGGPWITIFPHPCSIFGSLTRARTWDILINSQTLYQLSYQETISVCNYTG